MVVSLGFLAMFISIGKCNELFVHNSERTDREKAVRAMMCG